MQVKIFLMMLMALIMSAYRAFLGPPALASIVLTVFQARRGRVLGIFTVVPGILLIIPTFALNQVFRITPRIGTIIPAMQKAILFWLKARADLIRLVSGTQQKFSTANDSTTGPSGRSQLNSRRHAPILNSRFATA